MAVAVCFVLMLALQFATSAWWWIMVVPLGYGLWQGRTAWQSARVGMMSAGALWLLWSGYQYANGARLVAARVGAMLTLPHGAWLILLTTLVAVLAAGVAASSGYLLRAAWSRK